MSKRRHMTIWVIGLLAWPAAKGQAGLNTELKALAEAHHGRVALYAENLRSHVTVGLSPDEPVQTASVIKLAILYEALEQIRAGKAAWSDRLTLTKGDQVPGSGVLRLFDAPLPLTLKDALTMMVVMSDNSATNLCIDKLELGKINARAALLGLKNTYLYKKVFTPVSPGTVLPEDFKRFGLGKTTPREMNTLMTKIVTCDLGGPVQAGDGALCVGAMHMLRLQNTRTGIPRYLDGMAGVTEDSIANKTGALNAVRNDVGAVSTPNGVIVMSIFTFDNKDQSWGVEQEGELTIARMAKAIVTAWSPAGLAPWPKDAPK